MKTKTNLLFLAVFLGIQLAYAQERPFEVFESITSSTTWYKIKMGRGFLSVDSYHNVIISNSDSEIDKNLWAFIKKNGKGFKIVNKYLGPTYRIHHYDDGPVSWGDQATMKGRNGHTFYWKMNRSGISSLYTKSIFNHFLRSDNRGNVIFEMNPEYVEFIEYGSDEDLKKREEAKLAEERRKAEEREAAMRAQAAARETQKNELKKYIVGSWTYSDANNTTTETYYADGTMKTDLLQHIEEGNKVIIISSSFTSTYNVSDANSYTFRPNENSFKWKINKISGFSQAETNQVRNMDYKQMVYLGPNGNRVTILNSNEMYVENLYSGVTQKYKRRE